MGTAVNRSALSLKWYLIMENLSLNTALIVSLISIAVFIILFLLMLSGKNAKVPDGSDFYTDIDDSM
ncbi:MAG: hypothetical protein CMQ16_07325 [Gammaproteobacteria bacterium]|nr:hypothetical protein [Gammaproteobacteria bacterium]